MIRRYRERLLMTKEEFFEEIEGELVQELMLQKAAVRDEAYQAELLNQREAILATLDEIDRGKKALEQGFVAYMKEFTEELKYMALDIAERVLHKEIDEDKHALESLALQLVSEVKDASWINVEVSEHVDGLADSLKGKLQKAEQGKTVFVEVKEVPPDTCRIVTEEGVVDATLSIQLKQLRDAFVKAEMEGE